MFKDKRRVTFTYKPDLCLKIRDEYLKLVKGL